MILYLIRHAIAVEAAEFEGEDSQRPLTGKGKKKMQAIAQGLKELEIQLDLILNSPYLRAAQRQVRQAGVLRHEGHEPDPRRVEWGRRSRTRQRLYSKHGGIQLSGRSRLRVAWAADPVRAATAGRASPVRACHTPGHGLDGYGHVGRG